VLWAAAPVAGGAVAWPGSMVAGKQRTRGAKRGDRRVQRRENQSCLLDEACRRYGPVMVTAAAGGSGKEELSVVTGR
jgi:hypothetical protein